MTENDAAVQDRLIDLQARIEELEGEKVRILSDLAWKQKPTRQHSKNCCENYFTSSSKQTQEQLDAFKDEILKHSQFLPAKLVHTQLLEIVNRVAPISALPAGVLAAIFEAGQQADAWINCRDWKHDETKGSFTRRLPFEIVVSRVNRRWREVALSNPRLWRILYVDDNQNPERIDAYLERSGTLGLEIGIRISKALSQMPDYIDLIQAYSHRWRRLSISFSDTSGRHSLTMPSHDISTPNLQYLYICSTHEFLDESRIDLFTGDAPNLKCVVLSVARPWRVRFPGQAVISLHLIHPLKSTIVATNTELRQLAAELPSLQILSIKGDYFRLKPDNFTDLMPSLRSLSLIGPEAIHILNICKLCAFPSLESLVIDCAEHNPEEDETGELAAFFNSFTATSSILHFGLQTLMILGGFPKRFTTTNYLNLIYSFPCLTHFGCSEDLTALIEILIARRNVLWPSMHTITARSIDINMLVAFLRIRESSSTPIDTLRLLETTDFSRAEGNWLREHVQVNVVYLRYIKKSPPWLRTLEDFIVLQRVRDPFFDVLVED